MDSETRICLDSINTTLANLNERLKVHETLHIALDRDVDNLNTCVYGQGDGATGIKTRLQRLEDDRRPTGWTRVWPTVAAGILILGFGGLASFILWLLCLHPMK